MFFSPGCFLAVNFNALLTKLKTLVRLISQSKERGGRGPDGVGYAAAAVVRRSQGHSRRDIGTSSTSRTPS